LFGSNPYKWGTAPAEILEWEYGEITGDEHDQVMEIARIAVVTQSMDYQVGPALVVEDFTIQINNPTTDPELLSPVRIAANLDFLSYLGRMGDARVVLQNRAIAMSTMTDDRLRAMGYYVAGSDHIRAATRHAITALRRARQNMDFRDELWDPEVCSL